jgi:TRAP-type C4-dicarboxylate transport system substrate-binding protein
MTRFIAAAVLIAATLPASAQTLPATQFNVVGSIGALTPYVKKEVPFWTTQVPQASNGAIKVQIKPFTELGFKGPEVFRLTSQGTLQLSHAVLNYSSGEVPINEAVDLAGLTASVEELEKLLEIFRPHLAAEFEKKHNLKLLGFGTYHAQVIYCRDAFTGLADLKGRKIRASGASQQVFVQHIGASPLTIAFAEVQPALAQGVLDCAITGALSGYKSKWHETAKFISPMPVNFGLIAHVANLTWWKGLNPGVQQLLETQLRKLEADVMEQARSEAAVGIACNTGGTCTEGTPASMKLVAVTPADDKLRREALEKAVLPAFAKRCGADCVKLWNDTVGKALNITLAP